MRTKEETSSKRGNVEQEPKELLNPWQEAGSRGLDTWFELPAVYAIPDGAGSEAGGGYECSSLMEHYLVALDSDKTHEGYYAWLEYELARWKVWRKVRCSGHCFVAAVAAWKLRMRRSS